MWSGSPAARHGTAPWRKGVLLTETTEELGCETSELCMRPMLRRAYGLFWEHAVLLMSAHVAILIVLFIGNELLTVGGNVLLGPFILGFYKILLRVVRNEDTEFSDLLSGFEYFLPAFIANILIHLIAVALFPFLVVPGLLALLTYSVTYFFIFEDELGFWDAMEASRKMVWGNFKRWLLVGVAFLLINMAGLLCFVVGLLVTFPFSHLLITLAYEEERNGRKRRESDSGDTESYAGSPESAAE